MQKNIIVKEDVLPDVANRSVLGENPSMDDIFGESLEFKTSKLFLYFAILIFSSLGNGLVFCLISSNRKLRQASSNRFLLSLSACDFLTPLLSIPFDLALEERGSEWPYGAIMCRVLWPSSTLTATASALTLAAVSLDRFRLMMHPFTPRLTETQIKLLILSIYTLSMAIVVPYIIFLKLQDDQCIESWPKFSYRQAYTGILFLVQYALPLAFMTLMYTLALSKLYTVTSNATQMRIVKPKNFCKTAKIKQNAVKSKTTDRKLTMRIKDGFKLKSNVRVTKMFIIVVVIFAIFMLPNQVLWLWSDFGGGEQHKNLNTIKIICWLFTYANCVLNPFIFVFYCKEFRARLRRMVFPRKMCNRSKTQLNITRSSEPAIEKGRGISLFSEVEVSHL